MTVSLARLERLLAEATHPGISPLPWGYAEHGTVYHKGGRPAAMHMDRSELTGPLIAEAMNSLPALIAAVKALNEAVILEYDHRQDGVANDELRRRAKKVREALAAFSFEEQA